MAGIFDSDTSLKDTLRANDVVRGVGRLFAAQDVAIVTEMPLPNGRRTDISGINRSGEITIVEVKVSRSDLLGDRKWVDYLDYCDRFFWALPPDLSDDPLHGDDYLPERCGIIRADRYGAVIVRDAAKFPISAARRKAETLRFGRLAASRLLQIHDPDFGKTTENR